MSAAVAGWTPPNDHIERAASAVVADYPQTLVVPDGADLAGNVQIRTSVHAVVAEGQRAILASPERERAITTAQHSDLAALETNHQSIRRFARPLHHWPTLTQHRQG